jgi:hypothetical protein
VTQSRVRTFLECWLQGGSCWNIAFYVMALSNLVDGYQRFKETFCRHRHVQISTALSALPSRWRQRKASIHICSAMKASVTYWNGSLTCSRFYYKRMVHVAWICSASIYVAPPWCGGSFDVNNKRWTVVFVILILCSVLEIRNVNNFNVVLFVQFFRYDFNNISGLNGLEDSAPYHEQTFLRIRRA